eukprot:TRINITY_DN19468_c0_g1_i1.p1 TRINITY_DN19468_c0_g1~~TRINITY_DN19468_c0_g1_i1.p1  ORF type:complete len:160 (+),score=38.21 TRINITY_DN19468_c0_g1_i1:134-613(+)
MCIRDRSMYDSGVFNTDVVLPTEDNYERVNHAVLVTGFGEENGQPYWNVKNSWGSYWGDDGYIKVARGSNTMNIEHMAVAAYPALATGFPTPPGVLADVPSGQSQGHLMLSQLSELQPPTLKKSSVHDAQKIEDPAFTRASSSLVEALIEQDVIVPEAQ